VYLVGKLRVLRSTTRKLDSVEPIIQGQSALKTRRNRRFLRKNGFSVQKPTTFHADFAGKTARHRLFQGLKNAGCGRSTFFYHDITADKPPQLLATFLLRNASIVRKI
jgi:hypothetical protein